MHRDVVGVWALAEGTRRLQSAGGPPYCHRVAAVESFAALAEQVAATVPRLGPVRLVAVDGFAGSGKTTFAGRLAAALGAPLVHTDDLLEGWTDQVSFWPRLESWVLAPLRTGRPGRYRRYDWLHRRFAERWHEVPVAPVLILEGVTAARATVHPELSLAVWVEAPRGLRLARGIARDGERLRPQWEAWQRGEDDHVSTDRTPDRAGLVVDGAPGLPHDEDREFVRLRPG